MSPLDRMTPDTEALVAAARTIAWNNGLDQEVLEGLARKIARRAQHAMLIRFLAVAHNDDGGDPG